MYREILSKPIELTEPVIKCQCSSCNNIEFVPETCSISGQRYGNGHEKACSKCKGCLVEIKNEMNK